MATKKKAAPKKAAVKAAPKKAAKVYHLIDIDAQFASIKEQFEEISSEVESFKGGTKAAGGRMRKSLIAIKKAAGAMRKSIMLRIKELKAEAKAGK